MQFYQVIDNRTSIKNFKSSPIDQGKLSRMVSASMNAPSWKNQTSYKMILVDDVNEKEKLAQAIENKDDTAARSVREAPVTAVMVGDPSISGVVDDKEYYLVDGAIAMEHFVLAATNEGYGSCWIAAFDENKVKESLSIPNNYRVIAMTPIGEMEEQKEKYPEKDVRDHIFSNKWDNAYITNSSELGIH
ncbi:nitroreductase family protein [Lutibacter sp. B2]|nr:nitroreductase family protein [Lutibacter sp. B2]